MKFLYCMFLACLPIILSAQSNYKPGLVVKNTGDTLKGFINHRDWENTPTIISFKTDKKDNTAQQFSPKDLLEFEIYGYQSFIAYKGKYSADANSVFNMLTIPDTSVTHGELYLEMIVKGKNVNLYTQKDDFKTRFFYREGINKPIELIYHAYLYANEVVPSRIYRTQLTELAKKYSANTPSVQKIVENLGFERSDLEYLISTINGGTVKRRVRSSNKNSNFFVGAGINRYQTSFEGTFKNLYKSSSTYSPLLSIGVDLYINPEIKKTIFRIETWVSYNNPKLLDKKSSYYTFKQYNTALSPQVIYNLYNKEKFKFYLGAGVGINYSFYADNKKVDEATGAEEINLYDMSPLWLNYLARTGISLNKKTDLSLRYSPAAKYNRYATFSIESSSAVIALNYALR